MFVNNTENFWKEILKIHKIEYNKMEKTFHLFS